MKKLRVVQYGTWMYTHAAHTMLSMRSLPQTYEILGVCEPDPARRALAEAQPAYQGLRWMSEEEILREPELDAVIVETKETEQAAAALKFARAGLALHVDKPCGGSLRDFEALTAVVREKGLPFQVGYMYRYNPAVRRALEIVRAGKLGEILAVELQMSQCYHGEMLRFLGELPGGMMYYLGCHLVDLLLLFQGEPLEVYPYNLSTGVEEPSVKDYGFAAFRYPHGLSFIKSAACEVSGDIRRQLVVSGTKGTIEIKPLENPVEIPGVVCANQIGCQITGPSPYMAFDQRSERVSFPPYGRYDEMMLDFARIVRGEKQNEYPLEQEERVFRLLTRICGEKETASRRENAASSGASARY